VLAWIIYAQGNKVKALDMLIKAADLEGSLDTPPVTPGAVLPARGLLADMLILNGDYSDTLNAYQASLKLFSQRSPRSLIDQFKQPIYIIFVARYLMADYLNQFAFYARS
jgi:hypothetical protein